MFLISGVEHNGWFQEVPSCELPKYLCTFWSCKFQKKQKNYFTQEDVTLVPVLGNVHHLAQQAPRYTKWEVLENHAPIGCNALYLHKPGGGGHFICWKKSPVDDKWYELDSIPYGGCRNRGNVKELTDADWYNFTGTMSTTVKRDGYTSHTTRMSLSRARRLPLESTQNLTYVDLQQVAFTEQVNCSRPASAWIQQDPKKS